MALETWAIKSRSLACFLVASWKSTQFLLVWLMLGFGARSKSNNRRGIVSRPSHFFINSCPSGVAQLASHVAKLTFNRVPRIPMVGNWPFLRMFPMNIALMHPSDSMSLEHLCVCVAIVLSMILLRGHYVRRKKSHGLSQESLWFRLDIFSHLRTTISFECQKLADHTCVRVLIFENDLQVIQLKFKRTAYLPTKWTSLENFSWIL